MCSDIDHQKTNSTNTPRLLTVAGCWSSIYELDQIVRQSHQLVLDRRIIAPSRNFQKSYHNSFQLLAMLRCQPVSRWSLGSIRHAILDFPVLPVLDLPVLAVFYGSHRRAYMIKRYHINL
jgi:hypothetical protein